jgi:site-specific recombinase XerD
MTTAALVPVQPAFTDSERLALAGFLAGYRGLTREAYALDLRQFATWCRTRSVALFAVRRADIEGFARDLEARGRARATVTRRLSTIAGFYKYAVEEELLDHSPAAHVRRPRQVVTIPLASRTARAIDLATGERCDGPVFLAAGGRRLDRHGAGRIVRRVARRAGISKNVGPHTLRHAFITAALDAGVPLRDVQEAASPR